MSLWNNPATNFVKYCVSTLWSGIVWFFKLFFQTEDVGRETRGEEFKIELDHRMQELNI
jgi:hypothetical protein